MLSKQQIILWIICGLPLCIFGRNFSMPGPSDSAAGGVDKSPNGPVNTSGIPAPASQDLFVFADPNRFIPDGFELPKKPAYTACDHEGRIDEVVPVSCSDLADGTVSITGINGTAPYLYYLDDATTSQDSGFFAGLSPGNHFIVVEDQTGCKDTTEFEVPAPLPLAAIVELEKAVSCRDGNDGILRAMVSGGTGPYRYTWTATNLPDTNTVSSLTAGTYEVMVSDQNNCTTTASFTLNNPAGMMITLDQTPTSCFDSQDGSVITTVSGGTPDYTFLWDSGETLPEPDNFAPGQHCVSVTDGRGCMEVACVEIEAPEAVTLDSVQIKPAECYGTSTGAATVFISGGDGNFAYRWNDNLQQISQQALRLPSGLYSVEILDGNGCGITTEVTIPEPGPLEVSVSATDALCFAGADGTARAEVTGGNAPFTYAWPSGGTEVSETGIGSGTYEVSVSDVNGCESSAEFTIGAPATPVTVTAVQTAQGCPGTSENEVAATAGGGTGTTYTYIWNDSSQQSGPIAVGLDSNTYIVTAMDSQGCTGRDTIDLSDLPMITIGIIANSPSCSNTADGRMGVNRIEGGLGGEDPDNYTFRWSTGSNQLIINNLAGNTNYSVTATDSRGCSGVQTRFLPQPDTIAFEYAVTNVNCFQGNDGRIELMNLMGSNSNFTINWGVAAGSQTGMTAEGLRAGSYRVTITDGKGCNNSGLIRVDEPEPISIQLQTEEISCYGGNEGVIRASATGGHPDYTFTWENNLPMGPEISNLPAGTYTLTVSDTSGCTGSSSVTIRQPATVEVNLNITDVTCFGDRDGRIEITTLGGTPPYKYSLNNIDYNGISTLIGLEAGEKVVYVRDAKECLYAQPVTVNSPPEFLLDAGSDITMLLGDTAELRAELIDAAGGMADLFWSAPYQGTLSCEQCDNPVAWPQNSILYTVTGYDTNGCEAEDQVRVTVEKPRSVLVPTGFTPNGDQRNDRLIVHGLEGTTIKVFRIFSAWGEIVYENSDFPVNDPAAGWDGTFRGELLNSGVYIWYLEAIYPFDQEEKSFKGQTTLIR